MKNPNRDYPIAILVVGVVMAITSVVGGLIVAVIVPVKSLSLIAGIMQSFQTVFGAGATWIPPLVGVFIIVGAVGEVIAWVLGPVRGLGVAARDGCLPKFLQKDNDQDVPVPLMFLQAILVTFWGAVFVLFPGGVNAGFWALFALTTTVYIVMYFLMYAAAIRLRYSEPDRLRKFKIPGGILGMWLMAGLGSRLRPLHLLHLAAASDSSAGKPVAVRTVHGGRHDRRQRDPVGDLRLPQRQLEAGSGARRGPQFSCSETGLKASAGSVARRASAASFSIQMTNPMKSHNQMPVAVDALFLGPKSENRDFFKTTLNFLMDEHVHWRRDFHPLDDSMLTPGEMRTDEYQTTLERTTDVLSTLSARLKNSSTPWFSTRYLGHMNSDTLMVANLAQMAAVLYNPNNVAYEFSVATAADGTGMRQGSCQASRIRF